MESELKKIRGAARDEIAKSANLDAVEKNRIAFLGRKGALTAILRALKDLPPEERKTLGAEANRLRQDIEKLIIEKRGELGKTTRESILKKEWLDVTRPGPVKERGHLHPITRMRRELEDIFMSMGFQIVEGPEVELEYYNFDALNLPETHPAREMQDTWWLDAKPVTLQKQGRKIETEQLLRTQVTSIQVRYMETHNPPFRIIMPGFVFRREATDASHEIQFYQMDGMIVDKKVSFADLKGIMETVMKRLFGERIRLRLRAGYFPFVEPGVEMDIECLACGQKGCSICKQSGWIEIFPGGIVHPNVFKAAGYDPREWQGIAFDLGLNRIAMMKYKIPDIRLFNSGDLRFLINPKPTASRQSPP